MSFYHFLYLYFKLNLDIDIDIKRFYQVDNIRPSITVQPIDIGQNFDIQRLLGRNLER